ncbi:MAG: hypothetical protein ACK5AZ_10900 [Bryobacteraceae bacterium]
MPCLLLPDLPALGTKMAAGDGVYAPDPADRFGHSYRIGDLPIMAGGACASVIRQGKAQIGSPVKAMDVPPIVSAVRNHGKGTHENVVLKFELMLP